MHDDLRLLSLDQILMRVDALAQAAEIGTLDALREARAGLAPLIAEVRDRLEHGVLRTVEPDGDAGYSGGEI